MAALPLRAATAPRAASSDEQFFIISSVDLKKDQLVLKRPTEVTVLMDVNDKTVVLDEKGKPLHLKDLRAGDTVWIPPGEKHWHGATPEHAMEHIAMQEHQGGSHVTWLEPVTDAQYGGKVGA